MDQPANPAEENTGLKRDGHEKSRATNDHSGMGGEGGVAEGVDEVTRSAYERWLVRLERKAPATQRKYRFYVDGLLRSCNKKPANQITDTEIQRYLNTLAGYPTRKTAYCAIASFLREVGRIPKAIEFGQPSEPRTIEPLTEAEVKMMIEGAPNLKDKVLIALLRDTGGRNSAICGLRVVDVHEDYIVLPGDTAKNKRTSIAPLRPETIVLLTEYLNTYRPTGALFGIGRTRLHEIVTDAAKRAGIQKKVYPHLFRHMKALELRRANAQPDTVMNVLGWSDTSQYNERYGRRTASETLNEARRIMSKIPEDGGSNTKAIEKLAILLAEGKIDLPTYQASIVAMTQKPKQDPKKDESLVYVR